MTQYGTDLNHQLDHIRQLQGKDPMPNPGIIQGFEPGSPPPPPLPPVSYGDVEDPDEEPIDWVVRKVDSPLIPKNVQEGLVKPSGTTIPPAPVSPVSLSDYGVDLVVVQNEANYKGHTVILMESERAQIVDVVLSALEREIKDHRAQLAGVTKTERDSIAQEFKGLAEDWQTPVKRKRGRPRKNV